MPYPGFTTSDHAAFLRLLEAEGCSECHVRFGVVRYGDRVFCGCCATIVLGDMPASVYREAWL